jgi:predicted heme/steroid binding protein
MHIPDRIISRMELHRNTGERGTRLWIALNGLVYDVTDCPKWRSGLHEGQHFAGQDLTGEFPEAPHREEVFAHECALVIGILDPAR